MFAVITMSLFMDKHSKSLSRSGKTLDLILVQIRLIPENDLSTETVLVASVFFMVTILTKFSVLYFLIGTPRLKSIVALLTSISKTDLFISIQGKESARCSNSFISK